MTGIIFCVLAGIDGKRYCFFTFLNGVLFPCLKYKIIPSIDHANISSCAECVHVIFFLTFFEMSFINIQNLALTLSHQFAVMFSFEVMYILLQLSVPLSNYAPKVYKSFLTMNHCTFIMTSCSIFWHLTKEINANKQFVPSNLVYICLLSFVKEKDGLKCMY